MATGTRGGSNDATLPLVATDVVTSGNFNAEAVQVVKLAVGALASATLVDASNPVPVSLPAGAQAVSVASLPLPTGASTEATMAAQSAKLPATLGQKAMTASLAVVVASDQSAVPVSGALSAAAATAGSATAVSVTSSATQIVAADATRRSVSIFNNGIGTVYIGYTSGVTTANGMPLASGQEREVRNTQTVYGIVASGTSDVRAITETS